MLTLIAVMLAVAGFLLLAAEKKKVGSLLMCTGILMVIVSLTGCTDNSQGSFTRDESKMPWPTTKKEERPPQVTATLKVERGWVSLIASEGTTYSWRVDSVVYKEWNDTAEYNRQECTAIISENKTDRRWHRYGLVITGESCWSPDNEFAVADSLMLIFPSAR